MENRRSKDNKMPRRVLKIVKAKIRKTRVATTTKRRKERERGNKTRREEAEKERRK